MLSACTCERCGGGTAPSVSGSPVAKVLHNFGRAKSVTPEALARLMASISRFLTPEQLAAAGAAVEDPCRLGGTWTLNRLWERLAVAAGFALVAHRALEPSSRLAATRRVEQRVAIEIATEIFALVTHL
jgi:hypothetical protein